MVLKGELQREKRSLKNAEGTLVRERWQEPHPEKDLEERTPCLHGLASPGLLRSPEDLGMSSLNMADEL